MALRLFVVLVISCGLSLLLTRNIPFSLSSQLFYDYKTKSGKVEEAYLERANTAEEYLKRQPPVSEHKVFTGVDLVVVIVTVKRDGNNSDYVVQTAALTDKALQTDRHFDKKLMFVCNVDNRPDSHSGATYLAKYMPYIRKMDSKNNMGITPQVPIPKVKHSDKIEKRRWQEFEDYAFCLNASMLFKPKLVLVLEDDVVPLESMFNTLHFTLKHRLNVLNDEYDRPEKTFTYLRLFYLLDQMDFISIHAIGDLFLNGCLECNVGLFDLLGLVCVFTVPLYLWMAGLRAVSSEVKVDVKMMRLCCLTVIVIALVVSRNGLMEIRRVSPQLYYLGNGRVSSLSAVLYPGYIVPDLVRHFQQNTDRHKDIELYKFSVLRGQRGYQLEPNIFHHIGYMSSLRGQRHIEEFV